MAARSLIRRVLSVDVGQRNLGVAILEATPGAPIRMHHLACYDVLVETGCKAKCSSVTKVDGVRRMCEFLADHEEAWGVSSVTDFVVEGQVRASPKNLSLNAALFAWCTLVHKHAGTTPPHMVSLAARNKETGPPEVNKATKEKGKAPRGKSKAAKEKGTAAKEKSKAYRARKKDAVCTMASLLEQGTLVAADPSVLHQWTHAKKRDDMADAALQGVWYIRNRLKIDINEL